MTDKEKAIIMAYTGVCMLAGDKFQIFHKYIEDIMGRPIMTHEIGWLEDEIKEKSKADFMALCADESDSKEVAKGMRITQAQGNGQGQCSLCKKRGKWNVQWMCFLYKVKGKDGVYCKSCADELKIQSAIDSRK